MNKSHYLGIRTADRTEYGVVLRNTER